MYFIFRIYILKSEINQQIETEKHYKFFKKSNNLVLRKSLSVVLQ